MPAAATALLLPPPSPISPLDTVDCLVSPLNLISPLPPETGEGLALPRARSLSRNGSGLSGCADVLSREVRGMRELV